MKYLSSVMLLACMASVMSAPMDSCVRQSSCLNVNVGECVGTERTVCLKWVGSSECVKDPVDTVSHSCPVLGNVG